MGTEPYRDDAAWAAAQDAREPLSRLREQFLFPPGATSEPLLYFAGHSLGLQPRRAREYVNEELDRWARHGVEGHFEGEHPWVSYHEQFAGPLQRMLGARPLETVIMNTLSVNLHLMMVSFYRPAGHRFRILIEEGAFPSDRYAVDSQARYHGLDPRSAILEVPADRVRETLARDGGSVALVLLGHVNYLSGIAFDLPAIVEAGHRQGCVVGVDLAHGAGNVALSLHDWDVDFAAFCNYKYLNAGPGGLGGVFVHERHARDESLPRFAGWWGHDKQKRFEMGPKFSPIAGAEGWQLSNAPILQMAALRASLELFDEAGMPALRRKSERLTGYLEWLLDQLPKGKLELVTPRDPARRGAMLTVRIRQGARDLVDWLRGKGAICDFRNPDIVRIAPAPLYNNFADVQRLCGLLREHWRSDG